MQATLGELCEALRQYGMKPELVGDADQPIEGVATLEDAVAGQVSFLSNPKYEKMLQTTAAGAVVVKPDANAPEGLALIRVDDPYAAITVLMVRLHGYRKHRRLAHDPQTSFIDPTARVGENATIYPGVTIDEHAVVGKNAVLYPGVYIGPRCRLGDDVALFPNVVVYDDCVLHDRVTIHAGTVIGEDGLGYAPVDDKWVKIPQIGRVVIEADVEIGALCAIDRATLGQTRIGKGTKFSNQIAIGHGSQIGEHCMFVAQVGLAGSVNCGHHVTMAGQVGVAGHLRIGDRVTIGAKAGVIGDIDDNATVLGQPAVPINDAKRRVLAVAKLPELRETVKRLEREVAELRAKLGEGAN